jgi:uncharacterized protein
MWLERCPWYVAGPILGALIIALRAAVNRPLGALGGYIDVAAHALHPSRLGFSAFVLAGIALGGTLFAVLTGPLPPAAAYTGLLPANPILQIAILVIAGGAMGVGARTAGGCTSGHGLTGMSLGSPASIVAAVTFFSTAVVLAHFLTWLTRGWL